MSMSIEDWVDAIRKAPDAQSLDAIRKAFYAQSTANMEAFYAQSTADMERTLQEAIDAPSLKVIKVFVPFRRQVEDSKGNLTKELDNLSVTVKELASEMSSLKTAVDGVSDRSAINDHYSPPGRRLPQVYETDVRSRLHQPPSPYPSRLYGTDVGSVSLPRRRRIGYTG